MKDFGHGTLIEILWDKREPRRPRPPAGAPHPASESPERPVASPAAPAAPVDLEKLRGAYLDRLVAAHAWLDFSGIRQVRNVVRLKLEDVFVPLDDTWVGVPAGEFLMGTTPEEVADVVRRYGEHWERWTKDEVPQHRLHLGAFRIGKYPVTNREFRRFVDAGGYEAREHWSDAGWKWLHRRAEAEKDLPSWRQRGGRTEPAYWRDADLGARKPNRPAVGVTGTRPRRTATG